MVHILKRGRHFSPDADRRPTRIQGVHLVEWKLRCNKCGREIEVKQTDERSKGTLPVMFVCPVHGTFCKIMETLEG